MTSPAGLCSRPSNARPNTRAAAGPTGAKDGRSRTRKRSRGTGLGSGARASIRRSRTRPAAMSKRAEVRLRPARSTERQQLEELKRRASLANPEDRPHLEAHPDAVQLPLA